MYRLSHTSSWPVAALFLAAGTWWLASVGLQAGTAFLWVPNISVDTTFVVVLGQWLIICLCAGRAAKFRCSAFSIAVLGFVVPLWPLLALTWLSSDLSFLTLTLTQLMSIFLAAAFGLFAQVVSKLNISNELRRHLRTAAGILVAAVIWSQRHVLHAWLLP
jgi:hypothetical protein